MQSNVVAIIVTWNGRALLERLLVSLHEIDRAKLAIIVVDNASEDGTIEMLAGKFPDVHAIGLKENIGYSAGINVGLEEARRRAPRFIWVFNNDVVVETGCLDELIGAMEADAEIGIAGPLVCDYVSGKIAHAGYRISLRTGRMIEFAEPKTAKHYEVDSAFGCSNLIRFGVVEDIGGFDAAFNVYFDETEFNTRAKKAGWKIVVVPSARVRHEESATMNKRLHRKAWLLLRNLVLFELKHASAFQLAIFFPYFVFIHIPQFVIRGIWYAYNVRKQNGK